MNHCLSKQKIFMNNYPNSEKTTEGIRISVSPEYVPSDSNPDRGEYLFKYKIKISNESDEIVKLISRYWLIINSDGDEEVIEGDGVVGYNPVLPPGQYFEYESFCPLNTSWGTMEGYYVMQKENGEEFNAMIDRFYLCDLSLV